MADCGYRAPPAPHLARPSGEGGIRTREAFTPTRFPIVRTRPDYATSPLTLPTRDRTVSQEKLSLGEEKAPVPGASSSSQQSPFGDRREGWDSNPRRSKPRSGFRDRPNRPLWHLPAKDYNTGTSVEQKLHLQLRVRPVRLDKLYLIGLQNKALRCIIGYGSASIYNGVRGNAGAFF
jgi:hypothetical protein